MLRTNSRVSASGTSDTDGSRNWNCCCYRFLHGRDCRARIGRFQEGGWKLAVNAKLRAVPGSTFVFGRHVILPSSTIVEMVAIVRALDAMPQVMAMDMAPHYSNITRVRRIAALVSEKDTGTKIYPCWKNLNAVPHKSGECLCCEGNPCPQEGTLEPSICLTPCQHKSSWGEISPGVHAGVGWEPLERVL